MEIKTRINSEEIKKINDILNILISITLVIFLDENIERESVTKLVK